MNAPRFYFPPPLPADATSELPPEAAHHASRVLRLREGDAVQIFDGVGTALDARISAIRGKHVLLHELQTCVAEAATHSQLRITLAQAMCGSEKMDWVVQKATELGATAVEPVQTQRSVAKLAGERAEKRAVHWKSVAIGACEQCGRNTLPVIRAPQDFGTWLAATRDNTGSKFILLPEGSTTLAGQPKPAGPVTLLIGPEGGFTEEESLMARHAGFVPIRLGSLILRTETAAVAGITALQTLWGDFS